MHTVKVIAVGLVLLAACVALARWTGNGPRATLTGVKWFLPLWFVGAGINVWIGVARAGYSIRDEAPVFFVVFGVPAVIAGLVWYLVGRTA